MQVNRAQDPNRHQQAGNAPPSALNDMTRARIILAQTSLDRLPNNDLGHLEHGKANSKPDLAKLNDLWLSIHPRMLKGLNPTNRYLVEQSGQLVKHITKFMLSKDCLFRNGSWSLRKSYHTKFASRF